MKKYAEIFKSEVVYVHETPDDLIPVFNPNSFRFVVEITGMSPEPAARWKHDAGTGAFTEPDTIYLNPITSKDFYLRLTGTEREAFIVSLDGKVRQFAYWLSLSGDVDLNEQKIIAATNYLESSGIIGVGKAQVILTIEET